MKFLQTGLIVLSAVLILSGCSSTGKPKGEGDEELGAGGAGGPEIGKYKDGSGGAYGTGQRGRGANGAYGADGSDGAYGAEGADGQYGGASPGDAGSPLSKRIVYFMYDSSEVQAQYLPVINSHANYLAANPGKTLVLEGHGDERGSPEYNIGLGEQRAKAVAKLMKLQGATDRQIQIVSFGEEKPQVSGHDDSAWQQNRRVEISYPE